MAAAMLAMLSGATPLGSLEAPGSLVVNVTGLRSDKGLVRICLAVDPDNFPDCADDRNAITRSVRAASGPVHIGGLAPGAYAVALIHDENANAKLDTFAGIPREGIGFSRNPRVTFGPPRFEAARFTIDGTPAAQTIRMKYFL